MGIMDKLKKEEKTAKAEKKTVKKAAPKKAAPKEEKVAPTSGYAYKIIVRPIVTEKAAIMQSSRTYAFEVVNSAKKVDVKKAVKELYGVNPVSVRVINVQGHRVRFGKFSGKRSDYKKAMVTLKPGDSITIHEGV